MERFHQRATPPRHRWEDRRFKTWSEMTSYQHQFRQPPNSSHTNTDTHLRKTLYERVKGETVENGRGEEMLGKRGKNGKRRPLLVAQGRCVLAAAARRQPLPSDSNSDRNTRHGQLVRRKRQQTKAAIL